MLFLSTFTNKIDRKGRVSVPANFRTVIRKEEFQGVIAYCSFTNECIEACSISRISRISEVIDQLDPYSQVRDAFATSILGGSFQLSFDIDGRILLPEKLISEAGLEDKAIFIGKGQSFEIWNPEKFNNYLSNARDIARENRNSLKISSYENKK